ncbi:kinesin heavy chain, putative [Ixodes scapularis]|uniref:Kinesin-like protein n=1 Tax=Ixodes scapularis TaxID=6945 RepID=B7PND4_IXOSC|nr:kinesin heavy chain, putative [Ixodes scapularis]|eukprot:XP_002435274.1 kinesin heavy chain, putative [Ixodes scapularis]
MAAMTGGLQVGASVDIQRTDGRIHSATVVSLDVPKQVMVVEWHERGETKGKELEFSTVYALNPGLQDTNRNSIKKVGALSCQSLESRHHCHSRTRFVPAGLPEAPTRFAGAAGLRRGAVAEKNGVSTRQQQAAQQQQQQAAQQQAGADLASRRRTNVVKEVDRIKKQRDERRARQLTQIEEKRERMNVDPGNPNWEFLSMIREYRSQLDFRPLSMNDPAEVHQICVAVRKRPLNKKELGRKEVDVVTVPSRDVMVVHEPKLKVDLTKFLENSSFRFDYAFDDTANNELVYKYTARPLVQTIFDGGMATCFAYGQTGSGKTHTMGGDFSGRTQDCSKGVYALATKDVFRLLRSPKHRGDALAVSCSFFEIYSGKVFDLLNGKAKLRVLEDGKQQVQVVGLVEREVDAVDEVLKLIHHGNAVRTSGQTSANQNSSRSHAVFQIILRRAGGRLHGKFSLIDLAGNERGADTSSSNRQTRMEGAEINKSLLALKECIRALGRRGAHLPFRASKLTQVLRDSFIGENSRTCMIAMISPGLSSCEHSLNTLRYADRVKELGVEDSPEAHRAPNEDEEMAPSSDEEEHQLAAPPADTRVAFLLGVQDVEMSGELYNEAVSHLQEMEEEVLDLHKTVVEASHNWLQRDMEQLAMTNDVDYDLDVYVQKLKDLLCEKIEVLNKFKEKVEGFQQQLAEEELMSMNIKAPK